MRYQIPELGEREQDTLASIAALLDSPFLRQALQHPRPWAASLRRLTEARNLQSAGFLDGIASTLDDAAAVTVGEAPLGLPTEAHGALAGYRDALRYALQSADDPDFSYSAPLLKSVHFMMCDGLSAGPSGRWRHGAVVSPRLVDADFILDGAPTGAIAPLMAEIIDGLESPSEHGSILEGAMAHLNLALALPFPQGNGGMARALQALVLARGGALPSTYHRVEEELGRNPLAYHRALAAVSDGRWEPQRDATPWVRFMLSAHFQQAATLVQRVRESEVLWEALEGLREPLGLPARSLSALFDASIGWRIRNATYRAALADQGVDLADHSAGKDLGRLAAAGLLSAVGDKRGRHYVASERLLALRTEANRNTRSPIIDPFADGIRRD